MPPPGEPTKDDAPGTSTHDQNAAAKPDGNMDSTGSDAGDVSAGDIATPLHYSQEDVHGGVRKQTSTETSKSQYQNRTAVELDHFDPSGVKHLKRTLTQASQGPKHASASYSDITLDGLEVGDGPVDLEKFLRKLM